MCQASPYSRRVCGSLFLISRAIYRPMAWESLTPEEREAVLRELRAVIANDRYPLSPRVQALKRALDKLDPPPTRAEPLPPLKPPGEPSWAQQRRKRRR